MASQKLFVPIAIAVTVFCVGNAAGQAPSEGQQERNDSFKPPKEGVERYWSEGNQYWTKERLRKAKPLPAPPISEEEHEKHLKSKPKSTTPQADLEELPRWDARAFGTPTSADVTTFPYLHAGKLYFKLNGDHYCSAQFVGDSTVLLTAAHCVRDPKTGAWATNVSFFRAFNNGRYQQQVGATCLSTKHGWVTGSSSGNYKWDYAFIKTNAPSRSGYLGLRPLARDTSWQAIGYPSNFGAGKIMKKVNGAKGMVTTDVVQMNGNPMRHGNSGGAWQVNGVVLGHNSYHVGSDTRSEWSPYYDAGVLDLWRHVRNGC
jgi:V8-like Glu-specific endopeptidase